MDRSFTPPAARGPGIPYPPVSDRKVEDQEHQSGAALSAWPSARFATTGSVAMPPVLLSPLPVRAGGLLWL